MKRIGHRFSTIPYLVVIFTALLIIFSFGCAKKEPMEIKIGAVLPLTGPLATYGEVVKNALSLETEEVNSKGGINGKMVKLVIEDAASDPKTAVNAFQKLMALEKPKIVITTVSSISLALVPLAAEHKIILFAEAAHPRLSGISPFVFRHSNTASQDAKAIADLIEDKLHMQTVSILTVNDDYGEAMNSELTKDLKGVVILQNLKFDKTEMEFRSIMRKVLPDKPEGIIIVGYGKGLGIALKRLREMGYKGKIFTGFVFQLTSDAAITAGDAAKGVYYPRFEFSVQSSNKIKEIESKYVEKYKSQPNDFLYIEYDTLYLIFEAIKNVGYDVEKIREYLHKGKKFNGITGEISILANGDVLSPVVMTQFK